MEFIVVKEIPVMERAVTPFEKIYDLLREFDISEAMYVRVEFEDHEFGSLTSLGNCLRKVLDASDYKFRVVTRGQHVYLMKT